MDAAAPAVAAAIRIRIHSCITAWINKIVQRFEVLFTEYLENKYQLYYMYYIAKKYYLTKSH